MSFRLAAATLAVAALSAAAARNAQDPAVPAYRDLDSNLAGTAPFAVIGDTQETLFWERLIGRESNNAERRRLFDRLEALHPAFLVIAGDLTSYGSAEGHWRYFDGLTAGLRSLGVPVLPVFGNHDYFGNNTAAQRNFAARFTQVRTDHWYLRSYGALAMIFLDANRDALGKDRWTRQQLWYEQVLDSLETDPAVRGVLVFDHQPPWTNGTQTHDDRNVLDFFVPRFVLKHKTLALISGHTHSWEHFTMDTKHLLVSGGGGGPRVELKRPERHPDLAHCGPERCGPERRPYHFLWITPGPRSVVVEVQGFDREETVFRTIDRVELMW